MAQLRQLGCDAFVEIGPQPVLVKRLGAAGRLTRKLAIFSGGTWIKMVNQWMEWE